MGFSAGQGLWTGSRIPRLERDGGISNSSGHSPSISPVLLVGCESNTGSVITTDWCSVVSLCAEKPMEENPNKTELEISLSYPLVWGHGPVSAHLGISLHGNMPYLANLEVFLQQCSEQKVYRC